jgi:hypothetical protein
MSPTRFAFHAPRDGSSSENEIPVDALDLRDAVIGDGVLLIPDRDGTLSLYSVAGGYARALGTFGDAAGAWAALDALDQSRGVQADSTASPSGTSALNGGPDSTRRELAGS